MSSFWHPCAVQNEARQWFCDQDCGHAWGSFFCEFIFVGLVILSSVLPCASDFLAAGIVVGVPAFVAADVFVSTSFPLGEASTDVEGVFV